MQTARRPQARRWGAVGLGLAVLLGGGCSSMSNTDKGVLTGAGVGGVLGGVVGHQLHNTAAGAAIGAVAGGVTGGAIGNSIDKKEAQQAAARDVAMRGGPLTLEQVADMTHNHVSDAVIIDQIRLSRTAFYLNPEQIVWLRQQGVSDGVIYEMQMTTAPGRRVYAGPPPAVVVVEQPPPPPPVGFGVVIRGGR
jgi:outer membrane lipoprotein SlyB